MASSPVGVALGEALQVALDVLRVDSVALLLLDHHDELHVVAFTDQAASALGLTQTERGVGPGVDAVHRAVPSAVTDLAAAPEYAGVWADAAPDGPRAVLSCPVRVRGGVVGSLEATRRTRHTWTPAEISEVEAYARVVAIVLDLAADAAVDARAVA